MLADGGRSPRQAAKQWAKENEGSCKPWLWNV